MPVHFLHDEFQWCTVTSVVFFALLFRSLFRLVIPSSSAEFSVVAVLTVSFVQGRSEGDVRVEDFFKERA